MYVGYPLQIKSIKERDLIRIIWDSRVENPVFPIINEVMTPTCHVDLSSCTGAPKLINSDVFLEKRATVPLKTQGVQRSSSGKMSTCPC